MSFIKVEYFNALLEGEIKLIWETPKTDKTSGKAEVIGTKYFQQNSLSPKPAEPPKPIVTPKPKPEPVVQPKVEAIPPKPTTSAETALALKTDPPQVVQMNKPVVLKNVFFEQSSYILLPQSSVELDELAKMLEANPQLNIEIIGHTDNVGDPRLNLSLSENRAKVVMNYLIRKGIAESQVESKGLGGSQPITSNNDETTRAQNRRVEFLVKKRDIR